MYHCYFLINYIGPPKVFFLSFGPLFKKFAHHCRRGFISAEHFPVLRSWCENQTAWRYGTRRIREGVRHLSPFAFRSFSVGWGGIEPNPQVLPSGVSFGINHCLWLKCQKLRHSAAAGDNSDNMTVEGFERRVSLTHYCDWRARSNFVGSGKAYCAHDCCTDAHVCQHQHAPPIVTDWASTKAIPVRAWTVPEGSRRLRLPDFKTVGTGR